MFVLIVVLTGTLGLFAAPGAYAGMYSVSPAQISGNYAFHGSAEDHRGRLVSLSGDLSLDWLGDISGEALASRSHAFVAGSCDVLIDGSYTHTKDPQIVAGTIRITPGYGNCSTGFSKRRIWRVDIVSGTRIGRLELIPQRQSRRFFEAVATRESNSFS